MGIRLELDEVVLERLPVAKKVWETVKEPRLLVIGSYRMGFSLTPEDQRARLLVFIDYDLPSVGISSALAWLLGDWYARWCTTRMVGDAQRQFGGR